MGGTGRPPNPPRARRRRSRLVSDGGHRAPPKPPTSAPPAKPISFRWGGSERPPKPPTSAPPAKPPSRSSGRRSAARRDGARVGRFRDLERDRLAVLLAHEVELHAAADLRVRR